MPWFHSGISQSYDGGNLRTERGNLVLDAVADVALGDLSGVVEHPRGLCHSRAQPCTRETPGITNAFGEPSPLSFVLVSRRGANACQRRGAMLR